MRPYRHTGAGDLVDAVAIINARRASAAKGARSRPPRATERLARAVPARERMDDKRAGNVVFLDYVRRTGLGRRAAATSGVRVLVADGQALVRAGVRLLLERDGRIEVVGEATSGQAAVAVAERLRPDLVLIDAAVPGLDCVEATRRILCASRVAVMVLIDSEDDERILAALRAGAMGALHKDIEPTELIRAIEVLAHGDALLSPVVTRRLIAALVATPSPPTSVT